MENLIEQVKARAIELLQSENGFIGHSHDEIWSWKEADQWLRKNAVGVAICFARDEIQLRETGKAASHQEYIKAWKKVRFTKGNFHAVEVEVNKYFKSQKLS